MDELKNKVILITGAGKGNGRMLAEALAERGAIIAANDISPLNVESVVKTITTSGGKAKAYIEDIAKKVGVQTLVNQVEDDFGRIDILINHAAVEPHAALLNMDEWDWHRVLDVNLTGMFLVTQSVGRVMRAQGSGVVVNLITGTSRGASEKRGAFLASMAGALEFTKEMALELLPFGIAVHAITRGFPEFHKSGQNYPSQFLEAVLYLCTFTEYGNVINVE